jgi:hypothetical protein
MGTMTTDRAPVQPSPRYVPSVPRPDTTRRRSPWMTALRVALGLMWALIAAGCAAEAVFDLTQGYIGSFLQVALVAVVAGISARRIWTRKGR